MKRVVSVLLVAVMCCGVLAGCGGKPKELSQEVYDLGVETCGVLDDYVQGKMSQDTASDKLDELSDISRELDEADDNAHDGHVLTCISFAYMSVDTMYVEEGETYKAEDDLEELKELLNLK